MEKPKNIKVCDICSIKSATCLCFKCNNYFCDSCFKILHDLKKNEEHKKENLDIFVPIELKCSKHSQISNNLFCIDEKEICCPMCHFKNLHPGHKLIEIADEETLKKENFSIEKEMNNFNKISDKITGLKNRIENEIMVINNMFDKTMNDLKKSYQKKYEALLKEENDLKEDLQNKVTKVKEQLEIYLSEINNNIILNERINKGINKVLKEKQSILQVLSYISKINFSKKNMKNLETELNKSIKFNYEEKKGEINYEEVYINGIVIPKNIEFKNITQKSLNIYWNIDDINSINFDKNKIKYQVEMRKKNENNFKEIYQGKDTNFFTKDLSFKTIYEFRICSIYNDSKGEYSQIKEVETKVESINSSILLESGKSQEFSKEISEWCECNQFELLFRGTRDGMTANAFHNKCDNQGPTIILIKNDKDHIFGGYAPISWTKDEGNKNAPKSFLFTLTNIYNTKPTKFQSKNNGNEVYHHKDYGPIFGKGGMDLCIYSNFSEKNGPNANFPTSFQDGLGKKGSIFTSDNNTKNFTVKEIEIFKLLE